MIVATLQLNRCSHKSQNDCVPSCLLAQLHRGLLGGLAFGWLLAVACSIAGQAVLAAKHHVCYPITVSGKIGFIDENGRVIVAPQFDSPKTQVVDKSVVPAGPRAVRFQDGMAIVWKDGKAGYLCSDGRLLIEPRFEKAGNFFGSRAFAYSLDSAIILLTKEGVILHSGIEEVQGIQGNVAAVKKRGLWALLNTRSGTLITDPLYRRIALDESYATAESEAKWGVIDHQGRTVVPFRFEFVRRVGDYAVLTLEDRSGIYNLQTRTLDAPISFEEIADYSEGLFEYSKGRRWGYMTPKGTTVIPAEYDHLYDLLGGRVWGEKDGLHHLLDRDGRCLASISIEGLSCRDMGYSIASTLVADKHGATCRKEGVLDASGRVLAPFVYDSIGEYADRRAIVKRAGKFGIIDDAGKEVLVPSIDLVYDRFRNGFVVAGRRGELGVLDREGRWACEPKYGRLSMDVDGVRVGLTGPEDHPLSYVCYTDVRGTLLFTVPGYCMGEVFHGPLAWVGRGDESAYIDRKGKVVWSSIHFRRCE